MIARFALDLDANLKRLSEELRAESYRPQRIRRHYIPKPGSQEKRFGGRGKRDNRISLPLPYPCVTLTLALWSRPRWR